MPVAHLAPRGGTPPAAALASIQDGVDILVDQSQVEVFEFHGWDLDTDKRLAGGTQMVYNGAGPGEFQMLLPGSSFSIVGYAPPASEGHTFSVKIDDNDPLQANFTPSSNFQGPANSTASSFTYRTWYNASLPNPGPQLRHITISGLPAGVSVDYGTAQAVGANRVAGHRILIDDNASFIHYSPSWHENNGYPNTTGFYPNGGSIHSSNTTGDTVTLSFVGSYISVYGILNPTGTLTASYTIDNTTDIQTYTPTAFTLPGSSTTPTPNYALYNSSELSPTVHTLTITVLEATGNQTLDIDYFVYSAAFATIDAFSSTRWSGQPAPAMSPAAIAGIILGICIVIIAIFCTVCCSQKLGFTKSGLFSKRTIRRNRSKKTTDFGSSGGGPDDFELKMPVTSGVAPGRFSGSEGVSPSTPSAQSITRTDSPPPIHLNTVVHPPPPPPPPLPPSTSTRARSRRTRRAAFPTTEGERISLSSSSLSSSSSLESHHVTPFVLVPIPGRSRVREVREGFEEGGGGGGGEPNANHNNNNNNNNNNHDDDDDIIPSTAQRRRRQALQRQLDQLILETQRQEEEAGGALPPPPPSEATIAELAKLVSVVERMALALGVVDDDTAALEGPVVPRLEGREDGEDQVSVVVRGKMPVRGMGVGPRRLRDDQRRRVGEVEEGEEAGEGGRERAAASGIGEGGRNPHLGMEVYEDLPAYARATSRTGYAV